MKTRNEIRNTAADVTANPLEGLLIASEGIEESEARGQAELCRSEVLPAEVTPGTRSVLEGWGVVFGAPVEGDKLFIHVTLPPGWVKRASDHSMWSDLLDEKGRKRGAIFYKAAFYDRRANMHVTPRFSVASEYQEGAVLMQRTHVKDGSATIFSTAWIEDPSGRGLAREVGVNWLQTNYPGYTDPTKYWDV